MARYGKEEAERPLDPPEEVIVAECEQCLEGISEGCDVYSLPGKVYVCAECFEDYAMERLDAHFIIGIEKEVIDDGC